MATTCYACGKSIQSLNYMDCKNCKNLFDLECLTISSKTFQEYSDEHKLSWTCPMCVASQPKRDNSGTPVRSINEKFNDTYTKTETSNVNMIRGSRNMGSSNVSDNDSVLLSEIRQLRMVMQQQGSEISLLRAEVQELKTELVNIPSLLQKLNDFETLVEDKDRKIEQLNSTVQELQYQISLQEQAGMRNELEIHGISEQEHESLQHIVLLTSQKYGVGLSEADVDGAWRVGPRLPKNGNASRKDWKPRPIVVKLLRRAKRDEIIRAAKSRRNVTTEGITSGNSDKILIYERLSRFNRILFRNARLRTKQHNFSYCWITNGLIYVRKAEGAPPIPIRSLKDLSEHVGEDNNESTRFPQKP